MSKEYLIEAEKFTLAINIAIESYKKFPPNGLNKDHLELMISFFEETKEQALNPEPQFKKVSSLEFLVTDFLREFQENSGPLIDHFWNRINEEGLPYQKQNRLLTILSGKRIKSFAEYTYVTQNLVEAVQYGQVTEHESLQLKELVKAYEKFNEKDV